MLGNGYVVKAGKSTWSLVLLGPFLGLLYIVFLPLIAFMTLLVALPGIATAKKADIPENAGVCMGCHETKGMTATFRNNEKLPVFVSASDFAGTVHGFLDCTECHQKVSLDSHPGGGYASREAFVLEVSMACANCHNEGKLSANPAHAFLTNKTNAPPCAGCHGAHNIRRVSDWKPALSDKQYCLTCHTQNIRKTLEDGERISLRIDRSQLSASVHSGHPCSGCHSGFSKKSHPLKRFESGRRHSIELSANCRQCHEAKFAAVKESIHYRMVAQGNENAPVCTDCHGFHSVGPKASYDTLAGVPCKKCHSEIFKIYSASVHGAAKAKGQHSAPLCSACHSAHEVTAASMAGRIKKACLGCHKTAEEMHAKWLPNADLHLGAVSCVACHSADSKKGIYLRLYDRNTGQMFSEDQVGELLGSGSGGITEKIDAHGDGIDSKELWSIVQRLNEKGRNAQVTFVGRMELEQGAEAHRINGKQRAMKDCEGCHQSGAELFRNITVAMVKADGRLARFRAKPEVLGSVFSFVPLREFYVLGSTRFRALDWLGVLMVFGGISVPVVHFIARVLTAPAREARRLKEKRKGVHR